MTEFALEAYEPNPHSILTATGSYFDLSDPESWDGSIDGVATGLAHTCRFGGQVHRFYSVAEHSLLVEKLVGLAGGGHAERLAGLLHDAHEAFYGDIVSPLKSLIGPAYEALTERFDRELEDRLGLAVGAMRAQIVKEADLAALRVEADQLWPEAPEWADGFPGAGWAALGWITQAQVKTLFLNRYRALFQGGPPPPRLTRVVGKS